MSSLLTKVSDVGDGKVNNKPETIGEEAHGNQQSDGPHNVNDVLPTP
jgi:hypothetical protein